MSEGSTDRTKREMIDLYKNYQWSYQYSVFYDNPKESTHLQDDLNRLRLKLKNRKGQPFFVVKRTLNRGVLQAFATIFTTQEIEGFDKFVNKSSEYEINTRKRKVSDNFLASTIQKLKIQKLHDLDSFFGRRNIKRYSVINREQLVRRVVSLSELDE